MASALTPKTYFIDNQYDRIISVFNLLVHVKNLDKLVERIDIKDL